MERQKGIDSGGFLLLAYFCGDSILFIDNLRDSGRLTFAISLE
jgi:hypothetical protein